MMSECSHYLDQSNDNTHSRENAPMYVHNTTKIAVHPFGVSEILIFIYFFCCLETVHKIGNKNRLWLEVRIRTPSLGG